MDLDLKQASKAINELLWRGDKTLSTAESCTAGRLASIITLMPGSSAYFRSGLVCYQNDIKEQLLKVKPETIAEHDVVSEEVAKEMVIGANELFQSDYAVAVTGYAGPTGTPDPITIGNIWIAVGNKDRIVTQKISEDNGREKNLSVAAAAAIHLLLTFLREEILPAEETTDAQ